MATSNPSYWYQKGLKLISAEYDYVYISYFISLYTYQAIAHTILFLLIEWASQNIIYSVCQTNQQGTRESIIQTKRNKSSQQWYLSIAAYRHCVYNKCWNQWR